MILWRISNYADLSGRGGILAPGRWHRQGNLVVYCCDHPSTALLEILVHVNRHQVPRNFQLIKIICPDDMPLVSIEISAADLAREELTQAQGSAFLEDPAIGLIKVPSAILPEASNVLINPIHSRSAEIRIEEVKSYPFDSRLLR